MEARTLAPGPEAVTAAVAEIVAAVRDSGDAALLELTRRLDTAGAEPPALRVDAAELEQAAAALDADLRAALERAVANVGTVAEATLAAAPADGEVVLPEGHHIRVRELPVASAAVYVPGGRAPYPSTVVMGVVCARVAGVQRVAVCSPPGVDGIASSVLASAALCGADEVYRMGGAQAIAAFAYGTASVAPVDVIVGPGNLYVQEAKRQLSQRVGIDGFAGPSDLLVLAGARADPRLVALDLLAQAEHGPETLVAAASAERDVLDRVQDHLSELAQTRPSANPAAALLVDTADPEAALAFAEAFAPEHLELVGAEVEAFAPRVRRAGCLFVGGAGASAFGDYVAGSNHALPTGGAARFASALSPQHFRRRMAEVRIDDGAAGPLARAGATIARAEGFVVHAESMEARAALRDNETVA
ncbi:MAG: histidinol dehydrogenase [Solirubrobacterales bacterium]|nr:MAG: histidinol dehydrogenase [Solirubrobacterales bacterium]